MRSINKWSPTAGGAGLGGDSAKIPGATRNLYSNEGVGVLFIFAARRNYAMLKLTVVLKMRL